MSEYKNEVKQYFKEKADEYEDFLRDAYLEINKYAPIEGIDWLIKNIRINLH